MPKITHITTVHRSSDVRIFHKEAATLAERGYVVSLIVTAPGDRIVNGVQLRALPSPRSRIERMTRGAWRAYRAALRERADVYHFHDPELMPVGILLKFHGRKVVYDVHEDVVKDIHDKRYLPRWTKPIARFLVAAVERGATRWFDAIVSATTAIHEQQRHRRAVLVRNVPILNELANRDPRPMRDRARRVVYVGGLAPFNGVEQMVRAMGLLPADSDIRLTLGGEFPSAEDESRVRDLPGSERVDFLGWVDRSRIPELLGDARAGLVVYQPTPNIMDCEPNKFFEVLSAGLPLIASDLPHWRAFVEGHDCGLTVPPDDAAALARAIQALVDDPERAERMGARGRALIVGGYNWEAESIRLLDLYEELAPLASHVGRVAPLATAS